MEEKEPIEKDVELLDDISKFTILPPKRSERKEEELPVSKVSKIFSFVYVGIGAAAAISYIVLVFYFGRTSKGYSSDKGYGILPILFSSLAALAAEASIVFLTRKRRKKKPLFSSLSITSSFVSALFIYLAYCFSIIRKDVVDKRNIAGGNLFPYTDLVILAFAVIFAVAGITIEYVRKDEKKKKLIQCIFFICLSYLLFTAGAILNNSISFSSSGIALSVIGSTFFAASSIIYAVKKEKNLDNFIFFLVICGWAFILSSFLYFGLVTTPAIY